MQELTIEQLKFARSIGAVYYSGSGLMYKNIKNRASYYSRSISEWVSGVNSADFDPACFDRIDFTPLDDLGSDNKEQPLEWPEDRQDAIGQNGNDGEHYEKPETTHDVSHHKRKDGTDLIDEWWNKYEPEVARVLMWEMVNKYNNRLGKKDPVHIEVAKMADYMARWSEKEFELIK